MSDPILVIGNKNYSSWSLRPWLLLRHHGVAFSEQRLPLDSERFHQEIGQWSSSRRVPALVDGTVRIWDSLAICEYASERWLEDRGWPRDLALRALARSAAAEMHSGFADLRRQLPMNCRRQPDAYRWDAAAQRDIERVLALWRDLRDTGRGPFLLGDFGIVDAMFAPVAVRFAGYGVPVDAGAQAWMDALLALPAMREWMDAAAAERESLPQYEALRA